MNQDKDLTFLVTCNNEDLRTLCDILTYNEKGEVRMSEQLTNSDAYIKCYPEQMKLMAKEIGEELRKYGSNTVKTFCRKGEADSYELYAVSAKGCVSRYATVIIQNLWSESCLPLSVNRLRASCLTKN